VRGRSLDLPDRISLRDGNDVLVSASEPVVAPDPFVVWFLSDQDLLPADFDLAI